MELQPIREHSGEGLSEEEVKSAAGGEADAITIMVSDIPDDTQFGSLNADAQTTNESMNAPTDNDDHDANLDDSHLDDGMMVDDFAQPTPDDPWVADSEEPWDDLGDTNDQQGTPTLVQPDELDLSPTDEGNPEACPEMSGTEDGVVGDDKTVNSDEEAKADTSNDLHLDDSGHPDEVRPEMSATEDGVANDDQAVNSDEEAKVDTSNNLHPGDDEHPGEVHPGMSAAEDGAASDDRALSNDDEAKADPLNTSDDLLHLDDDAEPLNISFLADGQGTTHTVAELQDVAISEPQPSGEQLVTLTGTDGKVFDSAADANDAAEDNMGSNLKPKQSEPSADEATSPSTNEDALWTDNLESQDAANTSSNGAYNETVGDHEPSSTGADQNLLETAPTDTTESDVTEALYGSDSGVDVQTDETDSEAIPSGDDTASVSTDGDFTLVSKADHSEGNAVDDIAQGDEPPVVNAHEEQVSDALYPDQASESSEGEFTIISNDFEQSEDASFSADASAVTDEHSADEKTPRPQDPGNEPSVDEEMRAHGDGDVDIASSVMPPDTSSTDIVEDKTSYTQDSDNVNTASADIQSSATQQTEDLPAVPETADETAAEDKRHLRERLQINVNLPPLDPWPPRTLTEEEEDDNQTFYDSPEIPMADDVANVANTQ